MVTVFICGKASDRSLRQVLPEALAGYGGVQYFNGSELLQMGEESPRFLLYEWETVPQLPNQKGILFFKNSFVPCPCHKMPAGLLAVLETRNDRASAFLKGTGTIAVTCGTSPRDTLSLASVNDNSATVSVQRSVLTLDGTVVEPGDIPVSLHRCRSPHQILAVVSVLLLSGVPCDNGYVF